jgi:hypothetical protein
LAAQKHRREHVLVLVEQVHGGSRAGLPSTRRTKFRRVALAVQRIREFSPIKAAGIADENGTVFPISAISSSSGSCQPVVKNELKPISAEALGRRCCRNFPDFSLRPSRILYAILACCREVSGQPPFGPPASNGGNYHRGKSYGGAIAASL